MEDRLDKVTTLISILQILFSSFLSQIKFFPTILLPNQSMHSRAAAMNNHLVSTTTISMPLPLAGFISLFIFDSLIT